MDSGDSAGFRFDRLVLDSNLSDEMFAFPAKKLLGRELPLKDMTSEKDPAKIVNMVEVLTRSHLVRLALNQAKLPEAIDLPGQPAAPVD